MRFRKMNSKNHGQGLILMLLAISLISSSIALFMMDQSQSLYKESVELRRVSGVISAFTLAAKHLRYVYETQANCDPYIFNNYLYEEHAVDTDGIIGKWRVVRIPSPFRALNVNYITGTFQLNQIDISIGQVRTVDQGAGTVGYPPMAKNQAPMPVGSAAAGALTRKFYDTIGANNAAFGPADIVVSMSAKPDGAQVRYDQDIILINTCTNPAVVANANPIANVPILGIITNIASYRAEATSSDPAGSFSTAGQNVCLGDVNGDSTVGPGDVLLLRNYLRSAEISTGTSLTNIDCTDMNNDGLIDEIDLNILQKSLKGYLYYYAPSWM